MAAPQQDAIPLPPASTLPLPRAPHNPPNDDDFVAAIQYQEEVRVARHHGLETSTTLREAYTYTNKILSRITQGMNAAPPWATAMLDQINNRFDNIDHLLYEYAVEVGEHLGSLERSVKDIATTSAKAYNLTAAGGLEVPFQEVRFPNGVLPREHGGLPILTNITVINGLTNDQCSEYCQLYYPGGVVPHHVKSRKQSICQAIGCLQGPA